MSHSLKCATNRSEVTGHAVYYLISHWLLSVVVFLNLWDKNPTPKTAARWLNCEHKSKFAQFKGSGQAGILDFLAYLLAIKHGMNSIEYL